MCNGRLFIGHGTGLVLYRCPHDVEKLLDGIEAALAILIQAPQSLSGFRAKGVIM
jgi:hypothetical protein